MKTISVYNENGSYAGQLGTDCKPARKVSSPTQTAEGLCIPSGMTGKQLKAWKAKQTKLQITVQSEESEESNTEGDKRGLARG